MVRSFIQSKSMNWLCRSLIGNIVLMELICGLGVFILFCIKAYLDGDLSLRIAMYFAMLCALGGLAMGVLIWFGLSRPLLAQKRGIPRQDQDK
ncbi:hypothetical protein [Dyella sp. Tek66A03]|uniref:hypothetical protein n=1 Tax=Dyella sp. Tek66A03 TaxID=3458298 RepID=UPI00403E67FC